MDASRTGSRGTDGGRAGKLGTAGFCGAACGGFDDCTGCGAGADGATCAGDSGWPTAVLASQPTSPMTLTTRATSVPLYILFPPEWSHGRWITLLSGPATGRAGPREPHRTAKCSEAPHAIKREFGAGAGRQTGPLGGLGKMKVF